MISAQKKIDNLSAQEIIELDKTTIAQLEVQRIREIQRGFRWNLINLLQYVIVSDGF